MIRCAAVARRIAIIGSGISGLVAAHGLVRAGHEVTVYSDRSADRWLHESRPTGTAARFEPALAYERELGLAHWEAVAPKIQGVHLTFSPKVGNRLATLTGLLEKTYGQAIDLRLQSHRWMNDLEARGGRIVVGAVDVGKLDELSAQHELVLVATGRGPIAELFPRNAARSVYDKPQRNLAMVIVKGPSQTFPGVPFVPAKFNLFGDCGEAFWIPYHHRDHGASWCLLWEAKPGGRMDRFMDCKSAAELLERSKALMTEIVPWDASWIAQAEVADPNGWLVGAFAPTVRAPVGKLPSGRAIMPLGDTAMSLDPIGGQGANLGNKYARHIVETIAAEPDATFDPAWMESTFETFWADQGEPTVRFNNALLEPLTPAGRICMIAQYGSDGTGDGPRQRIANAIVANFEDPRRSTAAFLDKPAARAFVAQASGKSWRWLFAGGAAAVGRRQIGRLFGVAPKHPADAPMA